MMIQFAGNWTIATGTRSEIPWPNWTNHIRRRGQYVRALVPDDPRCRAITVLPVGSTKFDVRMAFGNRTPVDFNPWRIPDHQDKMTPGQLVSNPHDMEDRQFLESFFIAGGPWDALPSSRPITSREMNLKRCGMCQYVYARVVKGDCGHTICTVCLGLTALITVDRFCCVYCWRIPCYLYLSWNHLPGEMRLHLEGPEVVKHRSLAAHYNSR